MSKPRITKNTIKNTGGLPWLVGKWTARHNNYHFWGDGKTPIEAYKNWLSGNERQLAQEESAKAKS